MHVQSRLLVSRGQCASHILKKLFLFLLCSLAKIKFYLYIHVFVLFCILSSCCVSRHLVDLVVIKCKTDLHILIFCCRF